MKKEMGLIMIAFSLATQAKAMQIECKTTDFPINMGSTLRINVWEPGVFGLAQLYYHDGQEDILKKTWAQYNISKFTTNQYGQGVYYMRWGGGSSTNTSRSKSVPRVMAMYPFNGNKLTIGIFEKQRMGSTEKIYSFSCQEID